jgi:lipoprotein-anchoring transpeptidase ErfK/SrfK
MLIVGAVVLVVLFVGLLGFLFVQDVLEFGKFPAGVRIVGVSVAGLNKAEAVEKLRTELAPVANRPLTLEVDNDKFQISAEQLGLMLNYEKMVDEGYQKAWNVNIFERMARRFVNRPKSTYVSILASNNPDRVQGYLGNIINSINRYPQDAYVDVSSGKPVIMKALDGRNCPMDQLQKDTDAALMTPNRTVRVVVGRTPATLTDAAFGKLIIVNINEHKLSLYNRDKVVVEYPVACGSPTYPSPPGAWKVVDKQRNPSWSNPGSGWAAGMPAYIAPGPGNPLGTRAMATSASGVLIHGTPSSWSIGTNVSHGCIRMYMKDVEALFEIVDVGTPVYIMKGAGDPGFDVKAKPH